jgi:hypothetical protein
LQSFVARNFAFRKKFIKLLTSKIPEKIELKRWIIQKYTDRRKKKLGLKMNWDRKKQRKVVSTRTKILFRVFVFLQIQNTKMQNLKTEKKNPLTLY